MQSNARYAKKPKMPKLEYNLPVAISSIKDN